MNLHQKILVARKQKGLTQEELADLSQITVRTIQRIENGDSSPRPFTLKAIASALGISYEELLCVQHEKMDEANDKNLVAPIEPSEDGQHFLKMLCLSCFSYLVVPFIHFMIPNYLLKRSGSQNAAVLKFAQKMIRIQLYWKISLWLLMLATLGYNFIAAIYFGKPYVLNFLIPFFLMYFLNAVIITVNLFRIRQLHPVVLRSA